jgi:hypothetical protein
MFEAHRQKYCCAYARSGVCGSIVASCGNACCVLMLHLVLTKCPTIGVLDVVGHHVLFSTYA